MSEFDSIRPYQDHEVPQVVHRILRHPELPQAAARMMLPPYLQNSSLGEWLAKRVLQWKAGNVSSVFESQLVIAEYFEQVIADSSLGVSVTGLDSLDPEQRYIFMSNHRDIVLDSGLLNLHLHLAGHPTSRMAVGDNLLTNELAADLMKLNKAFVVTRGESGTREGYRIATTTSRYIRSSLDEGVSVWIAQREGRAKNGWDRTDPALLKMLTLAYRDGDEPLNAMLARSQIVPVSVSYELDPCARAKAHELYVTATEGCYNKDADEDLQSIITGLVGQKGRIHLHVSPVVTGHFASARELAARIDRDIVGGMRVFPTHEYAAKSQGEGQPVEASQVAPNDTAMHIFHEDLQACPAAEQPYWLQQYANLIHNRADLALAG